MNDQRINYCATCFASYYYERSTSKFCSDLCRVKYHQKIDATKRWEENLNNFCKGSDVIEVEMTVEDAPDTDIAANSNTLLTPEQEVIIPLCVTIDEEPSKFNSKYNKNRPNRNRLLHRKQPSFMEMLTNAINAYVDDSNSKMN